MVGSVPRRLSPVAVGVARSAANWHCMHGRHVAAPVRPRRQRRAGSGAAEPAGERAEAGGDLVGDLPRGDACRPGPGRGMAAEGRKHGGGWTRWQGG